MKPGPIPPAMKGMYVAAGKKYGLPWELLAGVGWIETNHWAKSMQRTSSAGAQGPMQFMPGTWASYGVDGDGDGQKSITNPADAIPAAAKYLKAEGAPKDVKKALFAYNRADWYVNDVLAFAGAYGATACKPTAQPIKGGTKNCPPSGLKMESGIKPATKVVLRCGKASFPKVKVWGGYGARPNKSDHPMGYAVDGMIEGWNTPAGNRYGWQMARWYEANAAALNINYIIFDDKIWKKRTGQWRPYTHPNGATRNPTLRHLDHVHVSVNH